jgi:hypothetical protein
VRTGQREWCVPDVGRVAVNPCVPWATNLIEGLLRHLVRGFEVSRSQGNTSVGLGPSRGERRRADMDVWLHFSAEDVR